MSDRWLPWRALDSMGLVGAVILMLVALAAAFAKAEAIPSENVEALADRWADLEDCRAEPRCVLSREQWQELQALRQRIREGE